MPLDLEAQPTKSKMVRPRYPSRNAKWRIIFHGGSVTCCLLAIAAGGYAANIGHGYLKKQAPIFGMASLGFVISIAEIAALSDSTRRVPRLNRVLLTLVEAVTAFAMFIIPLMLGVFAAAENECAEKHLTYAECPYGSELERARLASIISTNATFVAAGLHALLFLFSVVDWQCSG
ncbi:hypothetical protein OQA88_4830 [Cercophora sp. LCS_1]